MSVVITVLIAGAIIGYGIYVVKNSVKDVREGKCLGCDCAKGNCNIKKH